MILQVTICTWNITAGYRGYGETFKGTPYDSGLDQNLLAEIADYFRPIRDEALESGLLNPKNLGVNIKTLLIRYREECCLT